MSLRATGATAVWVDLPPPRARELVEQALTGIGGIDVLVSNDGGADFNVLADGPDGKIAAANDTQGEEFLPQLPAAIGMTTGRLIEPRRSPHRSPSQPPTTPAASSAPTWSSAAAR
ncbi:hypothetical protein OHB12_35520 [Nocardia sp. NBC_01730]|uniref:hypothetical protein n=1 Tax=Nocardia sp. NBC_01730 TaxID=2975998 RepID=UPI002E159DBF|nr:hypothetical protein OHB12_35520 [Nocardia sp. NBC_01730]